MSKEKKCGGSCWYVYITNYHLCWLHRNQANYLSRGAINQVDQRHRVTHIWPLHFWMSVEQFQNKINETHIMRSLTLALLLSETFSHFGDPRAHLASFTAHTFCTHSFECDMHRTRRWKFAAKCAANGTTKKQTQNCKQRVSLAFLWMSEPLCAVLNTCFYCTQTRCHIKSQKFNSPCPTRRVCSWSRFGCRWPIFQAALSEK